MVFLILNFLINLLEYIVIFLYKFYMTLRAMKVMKVICTLATATYGIIHKYLTLLRKQ